ncbi:poly(ethylene terephthalate) hydrolase family protein [Pararhodonellum marinum]|uniref:poly(ethylene terephthalate) hydrolase family protein n=1 Tax=Pararhodonellum marinum TaxID=2755358 RepID=UPI00188E08CC|nr:hypothetical protein [Pararhodonellum marinum]
MKKRFQKIWGWIKAKTLLVKPGTNAIKGAAWGLALLTLVIYLLFITIFTFAVGDPWILVLAFGILVIAVLFAFIGRWIFKLLLSFPKALILALLFSIPLWLVSFPLQLVIIVTVLWVGLLLGAAYGVFKYTGYSNLTRPKKSILLIGLVLGISGLLAVLYFYQLRGIEMDPPTNAALYADSEIQPLPIDSPAEQGPYAISTLNYGSGEDKHRIEFGESADLKTSAVNGLPFIDNWKGISGWWREKYWGFDESNLPLNGRVWYPEGDGPFPLVLIVHGNHLMQDFSDPGYAYLGELLASQGMILVSVDQNFINASWSNIFGSLEKENDARAWLLLEHLKLWKHWKEQAEHPLFQKADLENIALIGHSRGGEAVAHAALFNTLPYYPDDASVAFDYNFSIQSIVAIAPVDGQYMPSDRKTSLEDLNYFVLHGSQDADVTSYLGAQQYHRINFKDRDTYHFKSGLYIYGANHGQFNTSWGNNDVGTPFLGLLNLQQLMSGESQRNIAKVYISAFLQNTLMDKMEYLPLFKDARYGKNWLPETVYLSQFEDSQTQYICDFEEDFDLSTTTLDQGKIDAKNLTVWKEKELSLKWGKMGTKAAVLGWHYEAALKDSTALKSIGPDFPDSLIANYTILLDTGFNALKSNDLLVFSLAESTEESNPKSQGKWVKAKEKENEKEKNEPEKDDLKTKADKVDKDEKPKKHPIDFSIELEDFEGQKIRFPLSNYAALQNQLEVAIWKSDFIKGDKQSEMVFQNFIFDFEKLNSINPEFNPNRLGVIRFVFDKSPKGVIILDNLGWMKPFPEEEFSDDG